MSGKEACFRLNIVVSHDKVIRKLGRMPSYKGKIIKRLRCVQKMSFNNMPYDIKKFEIQNYVKVRNPKHVSTVTN